MRAGLAVLLVFFVSWALWWLIDLCSGKRPRRFSTRTAATGVIDLSAIADREQLWALSGACVVALSFAVLIAILDEFDGAWWGFVVAASVTVAMRTVAGRITLGTKRGLLDEGGETMRWQSFSDFSEYADQTRSGPIVTWLASAVVRALGVWCLFVATLKIGWMSDTWFTPIPGVSWRHPHGWFAPVIVLYATSGLVLTRVGATLSTQAVAEMRQVPIVKMSGIRGSGEPVLVLRSFADDTAGVVTHRSGPTAFSISALSASRSAPLEDVVGSVVRSSGDIFTCGDPRDVSRQGGQASTRFLVGDRPWEGEVAALITRARLIVVIAGVTPGLATELELIRAGGHLQKTIMVFPPSDVATMSKRTSIVGDRCRIDFDMPSSGVLLAAVASGDGWIRICSRAADDVDYRCALRRALDELQVRA